ncbi:hypothetical protein FSP39_001921 [Pinctada imbricata]|uniref:Myotubularin phosphatase domain-containing protein n=1 Tax=Pinctada imbricata TaxID=66713 RepID=A0AA88YGW0_PINIB|nr:hypothetical protein FSP39_001921 [Pinctada imbricata]
MSARASSFFQTDLSPKLLPGERVVTEADSVLSFVPFTDRKRGVSGKLFVTNFKVTFITGDRSTYDGQPPKRQRNLLINDYDIPLTSIDTIYQVMSGNKRRKLVPGSTVSTFTKYLEIYCKNFSVHVFGFKFSPKEQNKKVANAIVHHAYPTKSYLLYAFEYGKTMNFTDDKMKCGIPLYENASDWEAEITRCRCSRWRVTDVNSGFTVSTSLPERFVVPGGILNNDLLNASHQYNERRLPTWCYTHKNGASLVRKAELSLDYDASDYEAKYMAAIQLADVDKGTPIVVDLSKECPSLKDLQQSHEKLKDLCFIDTKKEFAMQDIAWNSSVESTKWLLYVAQCLRVANQVADTLSNNHTVVLQEPDGRHFCCLISSLSQILLDPSTRTRRGFECLIQREWVAMGYPFQREGGLVLQQGPQDQCPVFLLFLDCLWQLLQQYPSCFAFSDTYLVTLWDSTSTGIFETFLFDSFHQKSRYHLDGRCMKRFRLPPVWRWDLQYTEEDQSFFNNPLYLMETNRQLNSAVKSANRNLSSVHSRMPREEHYALSLGEMYRQRGEVISDNNSTCGRSLRLQPLTCAPAIKLWSQCYLRWQAPAQIVGGGYPSQYLQQCVMVEEIICLQHKTDSLTRSKGANSLTRPKSDLIFSLAIDTPNSSELLNSTFLTSSFPFSLDPSTSDQRMVFTPINVFLENSAIDYDYTGAED